MPVLFVLVIVVLVNFSSPLMAQDVSSQAQETTMKIRGPRSADTLGSQSKIGPLSGSDTLWRVAEKIKPDANVSLYQVMYALYLKNPDAFLDDNLNHLRPGAILFMPSLREVQQVDATVARLKSEQDDKTWEQRQKAAKTPVKASVTETAMPVDPQWQTEIQQLAKQQRSDLDDVRSQFADSMQVVQGIVEENQQLKSSLENLHQELEALKAQLGEDSALQQQISTLLAQQTELLAAKAASEQQKEQGVDVESLMKNPLAWILAACIPAFLVLFSILLLVKRRGKRTEEVLHAANTDTAPSANYQSPLPPLDDNDDIDESLFELDDALLDDAFADNPKIALPDDDNDDLLDFDDALSLDDSTLMDDDSLLDDDSLIPTPGSVQTDAKPSDISTHFDPDNILSDTDLSALLMAEDDDDAIIELAEDEVDVDDLDDRLDVTELDVPDPTDATLTVEQDLQDSGSEQVGQDDLDDLLAMHSVATIPAPTDNKDSTEEESDALVLTDTPEYAAFDADDLVEEIELDVLADDEDSSDLSDQDQQIAAALDEMQEQMQGQSARDEALEATDDASTDKVISDEEITAESHSFDSSELDEFAESLVAEYDGSDEVESDFDSPNDEEALLSAELAELLEQVEAVQQTESSQPDTAEQPGIVDDQLTEDDEQTITLSQVDNLLSDDFSDEPDETSLPTLDLTTSDDGSVSKVTDATLSVENPSKILEQYPELDLSDDALLSEFDALPADMLEDDVEAEQQDIDSQEVELDPIPEAQFDSLMSELEAMAANLDLTDNDVDASGDNALTEAANKDTATVSDQNFDFNDDDFVEIDKLLASNDQQDLNPERFNQLNVDVGLDEFADIIGDHERRDVDVEDNGYAAKLDLVRAYIEIDDHESAGLLLDDILTSDAPEHVKAEALTLKSD